MTTEQLTKSDGEANSFNELEEMSPRGFVIGQVSLVQRTKDK